MPSKKRFIVIVGTRPEFIKLYPLIVELNQSEMDALVVLTGQHDHLIGSLGDLPTEIQIYCKLPALPETGTVNEKLSILIKNLEANLELKKGGYEVIVQGDTLSAMVGALWAFNRGFKIIHVEAGLRTFDLASPYPEEGFRQIISRLAYFHAAPTTISAANLQREGIASGSIAVVGNTVIDNVKLFIEGGFGKHNGNPVFPGFEMPSSFAVLTLHRRENLGVYHRQLLEVIVDILHTNPRFSVIFPVHPNPKVAEQLEELELPANFHLVKPLPYFSFLGLMSESKFVVSDSGGIQEECLAMSRRLLIARTKTERPEVLSNSRITLLPNSIEQVKELLQRCINETHTPCKFVRTELGDGTAAKNIVVELSKRS